MYKTHDFSPCGGIDEVPCESSQDLLRTKRRPEHFINYCFIVRNGIKRNRHFNEINPLVADISRVV